MNELKFVVWEDAFGCPAGWELMEEIEKQTSVVHSVGFVIAETEQTLTLAPHIGGQNRENQQYAGVITLPKRQIISISSLVNIHAMSESALEAIPFVDMTRDEIVAYFSRYGFKDKNGHHIEFCDDFLALVDLASK
ncbi:hypothetical protein PL75_03360 [Neisseria arctica]|uniref:Uncharacterized protein n=1 Tax=Neisseria arctica TaxID=1470200 RepID=A0A0J0YT29_9NEIS|nr:hypothetical protein [Neisseria arctica]KLT73274.1 hypothetical protein PL75_03360 [Neisseria arctica]UOO87469.1 hypothetical protein LVJ86_04290 [Neisseria arctica]